MNKKCFSATKDFIEPKLYMNDHWLINYKVYSFYMDQQSKIARIKINIRSFGKMLIKFISLTQLKLGLQQNIFGEGEIRN